MHTNKAQKPVTKQPQKKQQQQAPKDLVKIQSPIQSLKSKQQNTQHKRKTATNPTQKTPKETKQQQHKISRKHKETTNPNPKSKYTN